MAEDKMERTMQFITVVSEAQTRADEQRAETDKRLNALIKIVERYISERRNGNS